MQEGKPDLVIFDMKMVDYDCPHILQEIGNHFYYLPVILLTPYDGFEEDIQSSRADFYVVKSFDLTELKQKIAMALDQRLSC